MSPFCPRRFSTFSLSYSEALLVIPEGRATYGKRKSFSFIHLTSKVEETEGFQCLGYSNWTICSPMSSIDPGRFSTFSLSYSEAISCYPRELIMGQENSSNFKIRRDRGVSVSGAFKLDHLQAIKPIFFSIIQTFLFSYREANLNYSNPEGQY